MSPKVLVNRVVVATLKPISRKIAAIMGSTNELAIPKIKTLRYSKIPSYLLLGK